MTTPTETGGRARRAHPLTDAAAPPLPRAEDQEARWRNRIIGHGTCPPDQLLANPFNWRVHPQEQQDIMEGALDDIGWTDEVTLNVRTSPRWGRDQNVETMIDGHMRVRLALRRDEPEVPWRTVDLDPDEEREYLLTHDPISALAVTDQQMMKDLTDEALAADAALDPRVSALVDAMNRGALNATADQFLTPLLNSVGDPAGDVSTMGTRRRHVADDPNATTAMLQVVMDVEQRDQTLRVLQYVKDTRGAATLGAALWILAEPHAPLATEAGTALPARRRAASHPSSDRAIGSDADISTPENEGEHER